MRVPQGWPWFFIGFLTVFAPFFLCVDPGGRETAGRLKLQPARRMDRLARALGQVGDLRGVAPGGKMAVFEVVGGAI